MFPCPGCGYESKSNTGSITHPFEFDGSQGSHYQNNEVYTWTITNTVPVVIAFDRFRIEDDELYIR